MKKHYRILTLLSLLCLLASPSCTKLKDRSYNELIEKEFTPTPGDISAFVGSAYVNWRYLLLFWNGLHRAQENTADGMVIPARPNGWVDGGIFRRIHEHKWTSEDDVVLNCWNRSYEGITNCNRIIYQVETNRIPLGDAKDATIAELKVLRASYYYVLCDLYGNIPIVDKWDVPEGYIPEQSSRQQVFDFIVKEITDNLGLLSEESGPTMYARFNKWAAHFLLAKMYLNAEVFTGTPKWNECIAQCEAIEASENYILEASQKNVFVTENENSKEIILALPIDENYTKDWNSFDIHMQTLQPANQATYNLLYAPWGGICAVPQFINTFDPEDNRYKDNWIRGQQYSATGAPLNCTMGTLTGAPLNFINEVPAIDLSEEIHGLRLGKFEIADGSNVMINNDWPLFRYADVLLMRAESLLRTNRAADAATIVSNVRLRNFPANPGKATVTGPELEVGSIYDYGRRDRHVNTSEGGANIRYGRFLDELGYEFAQEAHRRQDLIRFDVFTKKSWFSHAPNGDYRKLFPIPAQAMRTNNKLNQNDGY
ncbi:MAG: RagB/SusD family nutrient uptake outer membrane protein [Candidatus Pseudobacter hemicellulosilyticus]|uniref:RagB/SusD family nutrient uptake outer membrane protein n=1 Tax=Candidatus Pseudobacter hemicellulosilyticus TaxID=3121375 RepID=A0AAJ5WST1_9BACT|nr:MAG: RagB/SusD family nutrient uptake outer membrane protein [Pseudobacter sp.]